MADLDEDVASAMPRRRGGPGSAPGPLGLNLKAEGIETEEQLRILIDLGCQQGQGCLWRLALRAADIGDLIGLHESAVRGTSKASMCGSGYPGSAPPGDWPPQRGPGAAR